MAIKRQTVNIGRPMKIFCEHPQQEFSCVCVISTHAQSIKNANTNTNEKTTRFHPANQKKPFLCVCVDARASYWTHNLKNLSKSPSAILCQKFWWKIVNFCNLIDIQVTLNLKRYQEISSHVS